jgi:hypothetical protein
MLMAFSTLGVPSALDISPALDTVNTITLVGINLIGATTPTISKRQDATTPTIAVVECRFALKDKRHLKLGLGPVTGLRLAYQCTRHGMA